MSSLTTFSRNVGQLFKQDHQDVERSQNELINHSGERLDRTEARLDTAEPRIDATEARLDKVEALAAESINNISTLRELIENSINQRLEETASLLRNDIEERFKSIVKRLDEAENKLAKRLNDLSEEMNKRAADFAAASNERAAKYEAAVDTRFQDYSQALDERIEGRLVQVELRGDERTATLTETVNSSFASLSSNQEERFEQRTRALDLRVDDRLGQIERNFDQRMTSYEKGIDQRLFEREKFMDDQLEAGRDNIVARTDLILQQFDQRVDRLRRGLRFVLNQGTGKADSETLNSFDQLTGSPWSGQAELSITNQSQTETLFDKIVDWKKTATTSLNQFSPDEQEIVDYLLSFAPDDDSDDAVYVRQHLRRFLATLQRIPPARTTSARVLELGSYELHFTPAIKKYGGYSHIHCANWSELDAGLVFDRTIGQVQGNERLTFEVSNFNAERDHFPYPDEHFSLILCCEMLEHLAHDPMHMLFECNRVLEPDGWLLVTTPNLSCARALEGILFSCQPYLLSQYNLQDSSRHHHREYTPDDVREVLSAAGFSVDLLETEDVWAKSNPAVLELLRQLKFSTDLRGDNIFALARKTSAPVNRYPEFLYVGVPGNKAEAEAVAETKSGKRSR